MWLHTAYAPTWPNFIKNITVQSPIFHSKVAALHPTDAAVLCIILMEKCHSTSPATSFHLPCSRFFQEIRKAFWWNEFDIFPTSRYFTLPFLSTSHGNETQSLQKKPFSFLLFKDLCSFVLIKFLRKRLLFGYKYPFAHMYCHLEHLPSDLWRWMDLYYQPGGRDQTLTAWAIEYAICSPSHLWVSVPTKYMRDSNYKEMHSNDEKNTCGWLTECFPLAWSS